jgi:DNA-binding HxlR family transcriptional regulator
VTTDATFDALIHAPYRLRICAMLAAAGAVQFGALRDTLSVSASVLSKHLAPLNAAGYVSTRLGAAMPQRHLWVSLTPEGRRAFDAHVRALRGILATGDLLPTGPATEPPAGPATATESMAGPATATEPMAADEPG